MKAYINLITKALLVGLALSLMILLADLTGIKQKLLQEKKVDTKVDEGEYILIRLADRYENFLKNSREELENERQKLLLERSTKLNAAERQKIESRINEIENEKKIIDEEAEKNLKEKADYEAKVQNLEKEREASNMIISAMSKNIQKLLNEKNDLDSYWLKYVGDLKNYFINDYEKDPSKKPFIEEQFKKDNGQRYIIDEYNRIKK